MSETSILSTVDCLCGELHGQDTKILHAEPMHHGHGVGAVRVVYSTEYVPPFLCSQIWYTHIYMKCRLTCVWNFVTQSSTPPEVQITWINHWSHTGMVRSSQNYLHSHCTDMQCVTIHYTNHIGLLLHPLENRGYFHRQKVHTNNWLL